MTRVFVAGLYSTTEYNNLIGCLKNMKEGIRVCANLISMGYAPFCCWVDFLYFLVGNYAISEKRIRDYTIEFLCACDIMLVISNSPGSGVNAEIEIAKKHGIPIVYSIDELINYKKGVVDEN